MGARARDQHPLGGFGGDRLRDKLGLWKEAAAIVSSISKSIVSTAMLLAGSVCAIAHGAVRYVDHSAAPGGDGSSWAGAYNELRVALMSAQAGDEIRVAHGTYFPAVPNGS